MAWAGVERAPPLSIQLLALGLFWPLASPGQEGPAPFAGLSHRDRLYDVTTQGPVVISVGYPGVVLRSTDGGSSFSSVAVPTREALFGVDVSPSGVAVAVGRAGTVLVSPDAGASWTLGNAFSPSAPGDAGAAAAIGGTPARAALFDVDVLDGGRVVATGEYGAIVVSEDAGKTWQPRAYTTDIVEPGAEAARGASISDPAAQIGLDLNGLSAEEANAGAASEAVLSAVAFADERRGWIVGEFGLVLATEDGGSVWKRLRSPVEVQLFGVAVTGAAHLVAVGRDGVVIESPDGGETWQIEATRTREHLFGVSAEGSRVVVVGARGTVLVREKPATPFRLLEPIAHSALTAARFNGQRGFIVGMRGHLLETRDGSRFSSISGE